MKEQILNFLKKIIEVAVRIALIGAMLGWAGVDIRIAIVGGGLGGLLYFALEQILERLGYIAGLMKLERNEKVKMNMLLERNQNRSLINQGRPEPKKFQPIDASTSNANALNESRPNGGYQKPKKYYHKKRYSGPKPERK